jgi:hypothetical protein
MPIDGPTVEDFAIQPPRPADALLTRGITITAHPAQNGPEVASFEYG